MSDAFPPGTLEANQVRGTPNNKAPPPATQSRGDVEGPFQSGGPSPSLPLLPALWSWGRRRQGPTQLSHPGLAYTPELLCDLPSNCLQSGFSVASALSGVVSAVENWAPWGWG